MGQMRTMKVWGFLSLLVLLMSGASLSYAQTNTFPSSGSVGIGTTSPEAPLDVRKGYLRLANVVTMTFSPAELPESGILFYTNNDTANLAAPLMLRHSATNQFAASVNLIQSSASGLGTGAISFWTSWSGNSGAGERMRIDRDGNVGIGTTSPTSKLHVAGDGKITGDLTVDGNIGAKYQDVAEWVRTDATLTPGTVVVIDPAKDDQVLAASRPYDTRVAGVVSSQPGIILGEAGEDKAKVAQSGRVKVKVDARYGAVAVGDLLVSSATAGHAMVSRPIDLSGVSIHRPGTIVGKALEPLNEGQGEILVLLTLQ